MLLHKCYTLYRTRRFWRTVLNQKYMLDGTVIEGDRCPSSLEYSNGLGPLTKNGVVELCCERQRFQNSVLVTLGLRAFME